MSVKPEIHTPGTIISYPETTSPSMDMSLVMCSPSPTLLTPSEPYADDELSCLQTFTQFSAGIISRSRAGPHFWQELVPRAAWSFPGVRHAMCAVAILSDSLIRRHTSDFQQQMELKALAHASKSVNSLLTENLPLDVILLTSATLGVLDLFSGEWETAITHVTSGAKLADQARKNPSCDPFVAFYCEAFAAAMPGVLTVPSHTKPVPQRKITRVRRQEAVTSLNIALASFDNALQKIQEHDFPARDQIAKVIHIARIECEWVLTRWTALLHDEMARTSPPEDETNTGLHQVESPWSVIMNELDAYLTHGGIFDVAKFEIAMERTLPFYLYAKAGPDLSMRQDAVELMSFGPDLRARLRSNTMILSRPQVLYDGS